MRSLAVVLAPDALLLAHASHLSLDWLQGIASEEGLCQATKRPTGIQACVIGTSAGFVTFH